MLIHVTQNGQVVDTVQRKAFPYGRRKRAVRYKGSKYGVRKVGGKFYVNADQPLGFGMVPFIGPIRQNPLGLPWWLWVGGGALALFLATRKAAAAPKIYTPPIPPPVPQVVDPENPVSGYVMGCMGRCR